MYVQNYKLLTTNFKNMDLWVNNINKVRYLNSNQMQNVMLPCSFIKPKYYKSNCFVQDR